MPGSPTSGWRRAAVLALLSFARARGVACEPAQVAAALGVAPPEPCGLLPEAHEGSLALLLHLEEACWSQRHSTQVVTPLPVARWIAAAARLGEGPVLDPAAGSGRLLLAALERRLEQGAQAAQVVEQQLVGVELDERAACVARAVLVARCLEAGAGRLVQPRVLGGSALEQRLEGFEAVLMNPPYGTADALEERAHEIAGRRWAFHRRQQDQSLWFLALGAQALRPGGRLVAIAPRYWLEATGASGFRAWLSGSLALEQVLDLGNVQVWPRAEVLTLLLVGRRDEPSPQVRFWRAAKAEQVEALWSGQAPEAYPVEGAALDARPWVMRSPREEARARALEDGGCRAEALFAVGQGCKTGLNAAFVLDAQAAQAFSPELVVPLARGRQVRAGALPEAPQSYLLKILEDTGWRACPHARRHLEAHRAALEARHQVKKGRARWFALALPQNLEWMDKPKLLVPLYARRNRFVVDARAWHVLTDVYFMAPRGSLAVSLALVALLLNSPPLEAWVAARAKLKRDGYREYGGRLLRSAPLPLSGRGELVVRDPEAARRALAQAPAGWGADHIGAALERLAQAPAPQREGARLRRYLEALVWACMGERGRD